VSASEDLPRVNLRTPPLPDRCVCRSEPAAAHSTFLVGGAVDFWVRPPGEAFPEMAALTVRWAREEGLPLYVLGGLSNVVVPDAGLRGVVLDTGAYSGWVFTPLPRDGAPGAYSSVLLPDEAGGAVDECAVWVKAGTPTDALAEVCVQSGYAGLERFAGLPGTVGGAVYMNARCFETSISDVLLETEILDEALNAVRVPFCAQDFGYKKSPFQGRSCVILRAGFRLTKGDASELRIQAASYRAQREAKGHFRLPSAGSVFKNNRAFGRPAGKIIEELGLRGVVCGGAKIAPWHGNLIVNTGRASSRDIRALVSLAQDAARRAFGITLEPEILFL